MEPQSRSAMIYLLCRQWQGEREEMLKNRIEAKIWSEEDPAKSAAVVQGDEAYL